MGQTPLVTVIMSVYNDAAFLVDAIESILAQQLQEFEFIIVDDGSSDGSHEIIHAYGDERLVVLRKNHSGLARSLNVALAYARGRYVARQDADDISRPDRLRREVEFLDSHPEIALVGSSVTLVDFHGKRLRDYIYPPDHQSLCELLDNIFSPLPHSTIMFRRDVVRELGGYGEIFAKAEDYDLFLRLVERHRIASIGEPLVLLRYRADSMQFTDQQADQMKYALLARALSAIRKSSAVDILNTPWQLDFIDEFTRWFVTSALSKKFVASRLRRMAELQWHERDYGRAVMSLLTSLRLDPDWIRTRLLRRHSAIWNKNVEQQLLRLAAPYTRVKETAETPKA